MIWGTFDIGRLLRNDFYSDVSLLGAIDESGAWVEVAGMLRFTTGDFRFV